MKLKNSPSSIISTAPQQADMLGLSTKAAGTVQEPTIDFDAEKKKRSTRRNKSTPPLPAQDLSNGALHAARQVLGIPLMSEDALHRRMVTTLSGVADMEDATNRTLRAVMEVATWYYYDAMEKGAAMDSAAFTRRYLSSQIKHAQSEEFVVLFLDNQLRLIAKETLFHGTIDSASIHPREVVKRALHHNAAALILAHNHPSGLAEPSRADEQITRRLKDALALIDVRVLDHFVVGDSNVVSFAERGLMPL